MRLTAHKKHTFNGHKGSIYTLSKSQHDNKIYSGSDDQLVVEWDLNAIEDPKALIKLPVKAYAIEFVQERNLVLIGSYIGSFHIIDLKARQEIKNIKLTEKTIFDIKVSTNGKDAFLVDGAGNYFIYDLESLNLKHQAKVSDKKVRSIAFNNDGSECFLGEGNGLILRFNKDHQLMQKLEGHDAEHSVNALFFDETYNRLLSGSRDGHINMYSVGDTMELIHRVPAHNYAIYDLQASPNGKYIASCSMDKCIRVWDRKNLQLKLVINKEKQDGHLNSVNKLLWSDYNDLLISTGDDRTIMVWEVKESE